jgi:DNA polymerase-3 subunit delta
MANFKPAYLIHGDDHGRIGERRAALRELAERESGCNGVECFEGDAATPEAVARALDAMTFAIGRRFLVVDGAERWKEGDVKDHVLPALQAIAPDTTIAFFGRDEGRFKVSPALIKAVEKAGGAVQTEQVLKAKELPRWLQGEATRVGVELDRDGAQALVALVGERQQRLLRELEKLALEHGAGARIGTEEVEASCASSAERKLWDLADAVVAGNQRHAIRVLLELRAQGERVSGLHYQVVRKLRDALAIAEGLAEGRPAAQLKKTLRMPPKMADRFVSEVGKRDVEAFRRALVLMADLELESRGGGGDRVVGEDTAAVRAVIAAAA